MEKKTHFVRDFLQNSIGNSSTSTTCNPIYIAGRILQLQITMEFHRQLIQQHHLQSHLHCGKDPTVVNHKGIPSATHPAAPLAIPFTLRERSYSCKSQWNSIGNSSTSTTCNPIYIAGTILQLQITMEFCRPHMDETQLKRHLQCGTDPSMIRPWSEHDPTTHETVSQPSHRRGRSSRFGDGLCMEKHRGFVHLLSLKNAFRARLPPKLHRQLIHQHHLQSHLQWGNDPRVANHNGILSTTHARKTVETPFTMRNRSETDPRISEHDPTTHETVSHPSHRRGRSSTFVDALCMEKHRLSCICYLSKTHFVRDFLQNSIGNSSTSTTCNAIYSEGTILQLQITMEFCRPHMHEKQLKPHLQCGTDPRPIHISWLTLSLTNSFPH